MKRLMLPLLCLLISSISVAQNQRVVRGLVQDEDGFGLVGASITSPGETATAVTGQGGAFEIRVSPYAKKIVATHEGHLSGEAEIDGSMIILRLKVDKKYAENKAKAEKERLAKEEAARIAEEKAKAEAERLAEAEAVRIAKEKAKAERLAQKEAARQAKEKKQTAETSTIISQNAVDNDKPSQKISKAAKELKTRSVGYEQYIEMSLRYDGRYDGFGLNYIGGYRLNPHLFAGVGTGVDYFSYGDYYHYDDYYDYPDRATIPLYANFRVNFTKKSWSPYVSLLAGCRFSTTSRGEEKVISPICSVHIGMNKIIKNDKALYLGIGMGIETGYIYAEYDPDHIIEVSTDTYGTIGVIMGLSF